MDLRPDPGVLGILFVHAFERHEHGFCISEGADAGHPARHADHAGAGLGAAYRKSGVSGGAQHDDRPRFRGGRPQAAVRENLCLFFPAGRKPADLQYRAKYDLHSHQYAGDPRRGGHQVCGQVELRGPQRLLAAGRDLRDRRHVSVAQAHFGDGRTVLYPCRSDHHFTAGLRHGRQPQHLGHFLRLVPDVWVHVPAHDPERDVRQNAFVGTLVLPKRCGCAALDGTGADGGKGGEESRRHRRADRAEPGHDRRLAGQIPRRPLVYGDALHCGEYPAQRGARQRAEQPQESEHTCRWAAHYAQRTDSAEI